MTEPLLAVSVPGRGRMYQYPGTDDLMPSVTNVIDLLDKPALPRWAAKEVAGAAWDQRAALATLEDREAAVDLLKGSPWRKRNRAAGIGTTVHAVAEALARDETLPSFSDDEAPFIDAFLAFCSDYSPIFQAVELTVFSETHRYAGTADFLATIDGPLILGDSKTGSGVYREVALQLAALRYGESLWDRETGALSPMPKVAGCVALHLRPGSYAVHTIDADEHAFQAFLGLRQAWEWSKDRGGVGPVMSRARLAAELSPAAETEGEAVSTGATRFDSGPASPAGVDQEALNV